MPVHTRIDMRRRTVWFDAVDPVAPDEVLAALDEQVAAGAWSFRSVADYSQVRWVPLSEDVHRLVRHLEDVAAIHGPRGGTAVVAGDDLARFGMARMYELMLREHVARIVVFHSASDALAWLNQDE